MFDVREMDGVRLWSSRNLPGPNRFGLIAGLIEDQRDWTDRLGPRWTNRPDSYQMYDAVVFGLIDSIQYVYQVPGLVTGWAFRIGPSGNRMHIGTRGIRFYVDQREYDQHPEMPLVHMDGRFHGSDSDWVVALADYPFGNALRYSAEIIVALRTCERFLSERGSSLGTLFG